MQETLCLFACMEDTADGVGGQGASSSSSSSMAACTT
jgi:hypothetical protein